MKKYFRVVLFLFITLLLTTTLSAAESDTLELTDDCAGDVIEAREVGVPILLVFSADDCNYCEELKREVLMPALASKEFDRKVLIREFDIKSGGKVVDFDGSRVRTGIFVDRYNIYATPTIVIVDYKGTPLADPIVGYNTAEEYRERLVRTIEYAILAMDMSKVAATTD